MTQLPARAAAFGVDALLALLITGVLLSPLLTIAPPDFWQRIDPVPLMWVLALILLGLVSGGQTPGKRWLRLRVTGAGCIACRELRRLSFALPFALAELLHAGISQPTAGALLVLSLLLLLWTYARPLLTAEGDFPHNAATGFTIAPRAEPAD